MLGTVGYLLILVSFVGCALAGIAYLYASRPVADAPGWLKVARIAWRVSFVSAIATFGVLIYLVATHQFQYGYVYGHSSRDLPLFFLISSTWAGQEGSFLLWVCLNGLVGLGLIRWARSYEPTVMAVIALCQMFLISMIVGLKIGPLGIGSSPFLLLAEKFPDAPMLQAGLVPSDGSGLNDLLQNYWMVIHPPTLFMGFALMIVPFAYAVSALWTKQYTQWVRPALPWALAAALVLGVGIAMGGYWAYVTLSFGGYWAWDPVENSSLVPWLIGLAAVHTMIVQKRSGHSHKASLFLSIAAYMFVVYSTFLTRSGILGDMSVHSFVDLGLYNQLLLWILSMGAIGFGLLIYRYRDLPKPDREPQVLSREFMIFAGAMLLSATAAVIILGTSAPVLGRLFNDNPATVPLAFYNKWTTPLSVGFVFLCGMGQLFWWTRMDLASLNKAVAKPIVLAVASTLLVLVFTPFVERTAAVAVARVQESDVMLAGLFGGIADYWQTFGAGILLLLLVFVTFFALFGNWAVLWRIGRGNPRLAGGAISHVGLAIFLLGVIASSGFSRPVSNASDDTESGRRNFVISRGQTALVAGYTVTYSDVETDDRGRPQYVLDFVEPGGRSYTLKPVVYKSNKEQWIQHPSLKIGLRQDLFVAVTTAEMLGATENAGEVILSMGDSVDVGDGAFVLHFERFELERESEFHTDSTQIEVGAVVNVINKAEGTTQQVTPIYLVDNDGSTRFVRQQVPEWDLSVSFVSMNVSSGQIKLAVEGASIPAEDWVVVQAYEKPFIALVWAGFLLLSFGIVVSMVRRAQDQKNTIERGTV